MNYKDQIKSPKWQKKRLEILNLRGFKCEKCNCEEKQLHVHHRFYLKNRKAWEYDNDVFQVLCHICHENEHKKEEPRNFGLVDYISSNLNINDIQLKYGHSNEFSVIINGLLEIHNNQEIYNIKDIKVDYLFGLICILKEGTKEDKDMLKNIITITSKKCVNERMD